MGRAPCCEKNGLKKGPWTPEEDQKLTDYITNHGSGNWRTLPKNAGLQRCGKSCRLRWTNYLRPDIKRGKFSFEEEETIIHLHSILGNKWSAIAARLPGRTDNEIKNYWNTHIRKRLLRMGIDPVTHSPRLDLLDLSSILNPSLYNHHQFATNPNSQFRLARLLGLQPLVNPEILKLATTLFSNSSRLTQHDPNSFCMQNSPSNSEIQNQAQFVQSSQFQANNCPSSTPTHCMPFASTTEAHSLEPISEGLNHFQPYNYDILDSGFDAQSLVAQPDQGLSHLLSSNFAGDLPSLLDSDLMTNDVQHNYVTSYDNLMFQSNDQSFSFNSVLSGPSSSSTPLNSNSNSNSNSPYITMEDERESYCSNFMKFEIPAHHDPLNVNEFM